MRKLLLLSLVGVLAVAGCSSTEPLADPPDIQGHYTGGLTFTATRADGTIDFGPATCPATFSVTRQQGYLFSGMMTLARGETDAPRGSVSVGVSRVGIISGSEKAVRKLVVLR